MPHSPVEMDAAFRRLTAKYAVDAPAQWTFCRASMQPCDASVRLSPGWSFPDAAAGADHFIPLLPWRVERRFVELKRLIETRTVDSVVMCRFSCVTAGDPMGLTAILYRELDLAEWLADSPIEAIHASVSAGRFANLVVRLASGILCSVEAGATLPPGSRPAILDRHEMIAQRGVASDRVVDTQVPQESVYTFTDRGTSFYTDTDAELYGMDSDDIHCVRAAYQLAARPEQIDVWKRQHERLAQLVHLALESDRLRQCLAVKGGSPCSL
jgi:hypothetical protein